MAGAGDAPGFGDFADVANVDEDHIRAAMHVARLGDGNLTGGGVGLVNEVENRFGDVLGHGAGLKKCDGPTA